MTTQQQYTIAAAQITPVFLDRAATVEKACDVIAKAGRNGARLVVFPEAFVAAYPDWVWVLPGGSGQALDDLYVALAENAITIPDKHTDRLCRAAKSARTRVAIGVNERNREASNGSLYNTLLYIDDQGHILGKHRKLMPTGGERSVWAQGDGSTLDAYRTNIGVLGGLICWENYMPLARQAMYAQGTQVYVAPTWDRGDMWVATLQHVAKEGGMYVVGCCMPLHMDDLPDHLAFKSLYPEGTTWINSGHSCIIEPGGRVIAGPVQNREDLLYAEVDLKNVIRAKRMFDVAGHYARPDVFHFAVAG